MTSMQTGLQWRSAGKVLGGRPVLHDVTFDCLRGTVTALIGPNGAGKSTLFRSAAGLLELDAGRVEVDGVAVGSAAAARRVAFMPEQPDLYPGVSVWEHVSFVALLHGRTGWEDEARTLLERFALSDRRDALSHELSQGMRRRLALVMALLQGAEVLLLDEPFNGLDPQNSAELRAIVRELAAEGAAVLVATHILADVARLAERIVVLVGGRVRARGSARDLHVEADLPPDADLEAVYLRLVGAPTGTDEGGVRAGREP